MSLDQVPATAKHLVAKDDVAHIADAFADAAHDAAHTAAEAAAATASRPRRLAFALAIGAAFGLLYLNPFAIQYATKSFQLPIHPRSALLLLGCAASSVVFLLFWDELKPLVKFFYHCFLKPLGTRNNHQDRLESFYEGQAEVYDKTRSGLLRGRTTMLSLCAAQLKEQIASGLVNEPLVWIDIGGGTGWNIEKMNKFFPISQFHKVYLVDLTPSLCAVARKRFAARGWSNVEVLCQDAGTFTLPGMEDPKGRVSLVTMSYSISMIDGFYQVLDRVSDLLSPTGLFGVVDFYVSGKHHPHWSRNIGTHNRQTNWVSRFFWQIWFDFDHINLHPARREYLEYKFGTVKSLNGRTWVVRIPHYVWLGCNKDLVQQFNASNVSSATSLRTVPSVTSSPFVRPLRELKDGLAEVVEQRLDQQDEDAWRPQDAVVHVESGFPLPSFYYQKNAWRLPYDPLLKMHTQFRNYIYAFTWEDPRTDLEHLELTQNDSMFVITSAGDNALEYAISKQPRRIHCIDMNPCQNHLLELKLACIASDLPYEDFWKMFGDGKHPEFPRLLDEVLSPHLTSHAYQFWKHHSNAFEESFYKTGYSGWALRLAQALFSMYGLQDQVDKFVNATTLEEQTEIWDRSLRKAIMGGWLIKLVLCNPIFLWNSLGVPMNQASMFMNEGNTARYLRDTVDPITRQSLVSNDNYFYQLCLTQHYTKKSCPSYLTEEGFNALRNGVNGASPLSSFRLHTAPILSVLENLQDRSITKALIMDHMDWMDPKAPSKDATDEILAFKRVMKVGGTVYWRSSGRTPWYNRIWSEQGFKVECIGKRQEVEEPYQPGTQGWKGLDRVNMYASFWKGTLQA